MDQFLIFYAPLLLVIVSIGVAFWAANHDQAVRKREE